MHHIVTFRVGTAAAVATRRTAAEPRLTIYRQPDAEHAETAIDQ